MAILQSSTTVYKIPLDQMKALIANDLGVPVEAISVRYVVESQGGDWGDRSQSYAVTSIEVTVDNTKINKHNSLQYPPGVRGGNHNSLASQIEGVEKSGGLYGDH